MSLPGTSRRCMRAAGAAVNYIARIAGITSIIRIKINVRASDVLPRGATKGSAEPSPDHRKKTTGVTPSTLPNVAASWRWDYVALLPGR
jgi:hypothetical protein